MKQRLPEALEKVTSIDYNPSIQTVLKDEIQDQMKQSDWAELRLGGEGEPTLNLLAVEYLTREFSDKITMTVMTNGLTDCASSLKEWGISGVSVAFPTSDPNQYVTLMDPLVENGHERVCSFVQSALACDLHVELTAIDRPDVNKVETQELARSLGVEAEIRWRPFFP
jgi:molybdenum cofactor biosynthesis enzyme MoaA